MRFKFNDRTAAYIAIAAVIVVAGCINAWYGWNAGHSISLFAVGEYDVHLGYLWAIVGVAFDALKCIIPAWAVSVLAGKSKAKTSFVAVSLVLWGFATGYSWLASSSAVILAKTKSSGYSEDLISKRKQLEADKARIEARNPWSPEILVYKDKPVSAIDEKIRGEEAKREWGWSQHCANASTAGERSFCQNYSVLKEIKATKEQSDKDEASLKDIKAQLATMIGTPTQADPITSALAAEVGWTDERMRARSSMFIGAAIELFSNLAMAYLAWYLLLTTPEPAPLPVAVPAKRAYARRVKAEAAPQIEADIPNVAKLEDKRQKVAAVAPPIDTSQLDTPDKIIDAALKSMGAGKFEFRAIQEAIKPLAELRALDIHPITIATRLRKLEIAKVGTRPIKYLLNGEGKKRTRKAA